MSTAHLRALHGRPRQCGWDATRVKTPLPAHARSVRQSRLTGALVVEVHHAFVEQHTAHCRGGDGARRAATTGLTAAAMSLRHDELSAARSRFRQDRRFLRQPG
jgi:hypothetical protein